MAPMVMSYLVTPANLLSGLSAGDQVRFGIDPISVRSSFWNASRVATVRTADSAGPSRNPQPALRAP